MTPKKIASIISLIEISQNNLNMAKEQLLSFAKGKGVSEESIAPRARTPVNREEFSALDVVEGYFDGESMVGDNSKTYPVPPNYASKTQLVVGDRMKWILTPSREIFKLIKPVQRERIVGTFGIDGDVYMAVVPGIDSPVRILKASATFAMKNLGLNVGDKVALVIPKEGTPSWGALSSVVSDDEPVGYEEDQDSYADPADDTPAENNFDAGSYFDNEEDYL